MIKRLFFDGYHIPGRGDVWAAKGECEYRVGHPEKLGQMIVPEYPWEIACINWVTVRQENGLWRAWYEAFSNPADDYGSILCYAESHDGFHWEKPKLGICEFNGSKENNIVIDTAATGGLGFHGHSIFVDPSAPAEARYRCLFLGAVMAQGGDWKYPTLSYAYSADGIAWTMGAPELPRDYNNWPATGFGSDTQNIAYYDGSLRKYVGYFRVLNNAGRAIGRSETSNFINWPRPQEILSPDEYDPPRLDYYNNAATRIVEEGEVAHYIFYSAFDHDTDTLDLRLATSRDGIFYKRLDRTPLLKNDQPYDCGGLYATPGIFTLGDGRRCIAYNGVHRNHGNPLAHAGCDGGLVLAAFTKDRLQGMHVAKHYEFPVCGRVDPSCPEVTLNADIRGQIRGELIDENWKVIEGFGPEDCVPVRGNGTDLKLTWRGRSDLHDATLKLFVDDADLWACTVNGEER